MEKIPEFQEEYCARKVRYEKRVDIYRSEPDERNRQTNFRCLNLVSMNNFDIRNYLLTETGFPLSKIPLQVLRELKGLEIWKENENPHRAFYFFDVLFGEATFDRQLTGKPGRLERLMQDGYTILRNIGARKWRDYDRYEEEKARYHRLLCRKKRLEQLSVIK